MKGLRLFLLILSSYGYAAQDPSPLLQSPPAPQSIPSVVQPPTLNQQLLNSQPSLQQAIHEEDVRSIASNDSIDGEDEGAIYAGVLICLHCMAHCFSFYQS